jgi:gliding motility-associated-like protein
MVGPIANASSQGIGLARTDGSGNVLSLAVVTSQTFPGFLVTFQSALLVSDGDSLVIGSFYENPTSSISILRICKTDGDGVSGWTKDYELPANSARLVSIRRNEAGYLVLLQLGLNASLLQTNSVGEVLWSYLYDGLESIVSGTDALQVENDHILIAAARFRGGQAVPTVVRLSKDGSQLSSCNTGIALGITDTTEISSFTPFQASTIGMELGLSDFFAEPSNFILVDELSCRENCPEEEDDCNPAFLRTYGPTVIAPNLARYEVNHHVDNGANVIIAGRNDARNPFVAALGPDGDVRWAKSIFIDRAGTVSDMIIDAEGMVCGTGTFGLSANGGLNTYTFRIDPATGNLLWLKGHTLAGRSFALSQLHHTPGDDFLRATGYHEVGLTSISKGILARINLTTGEFMALPTSYSDLGETSFRAFGKHPSSDTYYALANIQQSSAGTPQLARLNADGSVIFNKQYDQPEIGQAIGMVVKDATVTMLCESNSGGFVLVQTDTDGNWRWQKNYGDGNQVHGITALPDGFMVWITSSSGNSNAFIRLDDAGSIVWANRIVGTFNFGLEDVFHVSTSTTAMTISTINDFNSFEAPSRIIRSDLSGAFGFDCMPNGTPIEVLITTAQTIVADVPLQLQLEFDPFSRNLESGEADLELKENCQGDCIEQPEPVERCGNGLDDDGDGLLDCDDPDLSDNCCCLDPPITDFGEDQAFCGMVEMQFTPPASWERVRLSGDASGEVLGFEPGLSYGFTFDEPGTYFFEAIDTCGNPGFDTLILTPYPPLTLDLGPDVTVCENATVNLSAQPGFESYEWIDGSTERTFTTFGEGDFSVIATDSCGEQYTDTVTVTFNPATIIELGIDTTICPGDTLTFRLEGFTDIQWSQSSFIDCFDCAEIRFAPTMDTLLLVAAKQGPGCFSSDSLRVRIKPLAGARDTTTLCEGDSFSFGGQTISGAGQYYDFLDDSNCPVVDTLDVFGLRDTLVSEVMNICAGDSVLVFGAFEREANTYLRISTSSNGCDSTNQVILTVNQIVVTAETISICGGDSALVFGVFERDPDVYSRISTSSNGCDSTHQITLEVNDISATAVQVRPGCGGAAAGASQVFFESNGQPVSIRWSDNTATALNENLASGNYTVTVTTPDGCSATAEVTISNAPPTNIAPATEPESCPGENDGTITIPTAPPGFTYQLNGGPEQTNPQFQNLAPGPYQLTAYDTFGCPQTYDLTVSAANNLVFELPPNITINFGDSVVLDPTTLFPAEATINWLTDNGTGCPSCPTFTLRPQENVAVTATATDSSGCSQTRTTRITVSKDELFYVPNAFSPNGDGVNDVFRVYPGPAVERILSFAVFDRWGGRVFLREDFDAEDTLGGWDGLLAGRQNPAIGVYVYLVEVRLFSGKVVSGSGEVLVMR